MTIYWFLFPRLIDLGWVELGGSANGLTLLQSVGSWLTQLCLLQKSGQLGLLDMMDVFQKQQEKASSHIQGFLRPLIRVC